MHLQRVVTSFVFLQITNYEKAITFSSKIIIKAN